MKKVHSLYHNLAFDTPTLLFLNIDATKCQDRVLPLMYQSNGPHLN